ncbi:MAG: Rieske (2Fe-2S) protein [Bacteroidales bacterium]|nr:Rieske (2Fe-2S) protein [Bacteroidales bacterium]
MERRSFFRKATGVFTIVAVALAGWGLLKQFYPPSSRKKQKIKLGKLYEYPVDTYTFVKEFNLFIYRDHEGVRAMSAVCTHLGCILERSTDGFLCPCHGSSYNDSGEVMSGPAPRDLACYEISRMQDGRLVIHVDHVVDPSYKFIAS